MISIGSPYALPMRIGMNFINPIHQPKRVFDHAGEEIRFVCVINIFIYFSLDSAFWIPAPTLAQALPR